MFVKERERRRIIYDLLRELEADRERLAGVLEYTEVRLAEWSGTDDALPFDAKMSAVERLCRAAREREGSREGE